MEIDVLKRQRELLDLLRKYSHAYYVEDKPLVSDFEYDKLYDEYVKLEAITGVVYADSPNRKVQGEVLPFLNKVKHTKPMLSAAKTKSVDDIIKFADEKPVTISHKEDGLTLVLRYEEGKLVQAITRGNGEEGEDVTHTAVTIKNLPLTIPTIYPLEVRGECLISWNAFENINASLSEDKKYSHPRNLAAGSVRQLDANEASKRNLSFVAFDLVNWEDIPVSELGGVVPTKAGSFQFMKACGFEVVPYIVARNGEDIKRAIEWLTRYTGDYPVDGLVAEINHLQYGKKLGSTAHHENRIMAFKWTDELVETRFLGVDMNVTRTGLVSLTAVFEPVTIDNTIVSRASLHNFDIFEKLQLGVGDRLLVYKANMIIPQIAENLDRTNTYLLEKTCPCCGTPLKVEGVEDGARFVKCPNPKCSAKSVQRFVHFASKEGMNIEGVSEGVISVLVEKGFIKCYEDFYNLHRYKDEIARLDGFGNASAEKIISAIEKSRNTDLAHFLTALGIPLCGKSACKLLAEKARGSFACFTDMLGDELLNIEGVGEITARNICNYFADNQNMAEAIGVAYQLRFAKFEKKSNGGIFEGKTVVATGSFENFTRDSINQKIEELGGKSGFEELVKYCDENGFQLFPEFEFSYATENMNVFDESEMMGLAISMILPFLNKNT